MTLRGYFWVIKKLGCVVGMQQFTFPTFQRCIVRFSFKPRIVRKGYFYFLPQFYAVQLFWGQTHLVQINQTRSPVLASPRVSHSCNNRTTSRGSEPIGDTSRDIFAFVSRWKQTVRKEKIKRPIVTGLPPLACQATKNTHPTGWCWNWINASAAPLWSGFHRKVVAFLPRRL